MTHLVAGKGLKLGGLTGLIIYIGSWGLWAYLWVMFSALTIEFIRSGFDIVHMLKSAINMLIYPFIAIPMNIWVLIYTYIWCPLKKYVWSILDHVVPKYEQVGGGAAKGMHPIANIFDWVAQHTIPGYTHNEIYNDVFEEAKNVHNEGQYCAGSKSRGCKEHYDPRRSNMWNYSYWFCHSWASQGKNCTTKCD